MTLTRFTPSHAAEDVELVRHAPRGSQAALGRLHDRYAVVIHGLLLARPAPHEDAASGYGPALMRLDVGPAGGADRTAALDLVLASARRRDGLTLWHLLTREERAERERVSDRLSRLVPPPNGVTRDRLLAENREALARWWNALGVEVSTGGGC